MEGSKIEVQVAAPPNGVLSVLARISGEEPVRVDGFELYELAAWILGAAEWVSGGDPDFEKMTVHRHPSK